jgi:ATP-binding cassette subfamily B protein
MRGRTTLVIAHRLATVLKADRIAVLEAGRLVAVGSHAQLMSSSPLYARLAALQFNAAEELRTAASG